MQGKWILKFYALDICSVRPWKKIIYDSKVLSCRPTSSVSQKTNLLCIQVKESEAVFLAMYPLHWESCENVKLLVPRPCFSPSLQTNENKFLSDFRGFHEYERKLRLQNGSLASQSVSCYKRLSFSRKRRFFKKKYHRKKVWLFRIYIH